jgi:hypothetical protein
MNKHIALAAIAPFALLSACGSNESPADDPAANTADSAMMETPVPTSAAATPTRLADAGDFSGSYSLAEPSDAEIAMVSDQAGADTGSTAGTTPNRGSIRFNSADNTYEYTPAEGPARTGSFSRTDDNYRLLIEDFDGGPAYFAFSDGDLYRLSGDTPMSDTINVTGERYSRSNNSDNPTPGNPSGATNSVKDKRE